MKTFPEHAAEIKTQIKRSLKDLGIPRKNPKSSEARKAMQFLLSKSVLSSYLKSLDIRLASQLGYSYFENKDFCMCVLAAYYVKQLRPIWFKQAVTIPFAEVLKNNNTDLLNTIVMECFNLIASLKGAIQLSTGNIPAQYIEKITTDVLWYRTVTEATSVSAAQIIRNGKNSNVADAVIFLTLCKHGFIEDPETIRFAAPNLELITAELLNVYDYRALLSDFSNKRIVVAPGIIRSELTAFNSIFALFGKSHRDIMLAAQQRQDEWCSKLKIITTCKLLPC